MLSKIIAIKIAFVAILASIIEASITNANLNHTQMSSIGIQKLSNCKVKLDTGKIIDLTSLDRPDSPR